MVRKYVNNVTMSKLSTLVSHSTQADPRCDRSSTMCPSMDVGHEVCGVLTRSWRLATPRNTLENDDFTDLRVLGGQARMGERVPHATTNQPTAGRNFLLDLLSRHTNWPEELGRPARRLCLWCLWWRFLWIFRKSPLGAMPKQRAASGSHPSPLVQGVRAMTPV